MNLECPVVKDLYTLYKENELSREVKDAVDEHLNRCSECSNLYENEMGFSDLLKGDTEEQPTRKMDEKMMLKLKVTRLKVGVVFIAVIFLISVYYSYVQTRYNLLYDISLSEHTLRNLMFKVEDVKNNSVPMDGFMSEIESLNNQQNNAVLRDLNPFEKGMLKKAGSNLFMDFKVSELYQTLKLRYQNGAFSERDEKVYTRLKQYMTNASYECGDERLKLNNLYGRAKFFTVLKSIDIKNIAKYYESMNQLALSYLVYDKLPEEIQPLSMDELKEKIKFQLGIDDLNVKFSSWSDASIKLNGQCDFDAVSPKYTYNGSVDVYTGIIMGVNNNNTVTQGELIPIDKAKENLKSMLERTYGKEQTFKIDYKGINYHFSSNVDIKVYVFTVNPVINGTMVMEQFQAAFDARTGNLYFLSNDSYGYYKPGYTVDTNMRVAKEEGQKTLNRKYNREYKYCDTLIIKSNLSGRYVPAYEYVGENGMKAYVNASSGSIEFPRGIYTY